jgi:hypothetical protein
MAVRLGRSATALCAATAVAAAAVVALVNSNRAFVATAIAVVPLAWAALAATVAWWLRGRNAQAVGTTVTQADAAAAWLARETAGRWRQEATARRIVTPAPASVRWRWAAAGLSVPLRDAAAVPAPGTGPAPLPDLAGPGELLTTGVVTRLHDEVYARLRYGRLVLTGGPGAGKTAAMILLLLAALDRRGTLADGIRSQVPVPVWLTMGGWNPLSVPVADWVTGVLIRDYPALRAAQYGGDAAGTLLRSGRLALFLDGLDEMPPDLRAAAVRRLNDEGRNLRMVLTSRPDEYRAALEDSGLDNGAVIELRPVRPEAAAAYLLRGQAGPARERWQRFADSLRANPGSVLAEALDNPLTLSLARDAYATDDPGVLADAARFPTVKAITAHLIDQLLVTAYPDERHRAHAVHWLSWIAARMGAGQDLRWWDIPSWVPRWQLRVARGLEAGAAAWSLVTLAAWLTYWQSTATVPAAGIPVWGPPGCAIGIAVACLAGLGFPIGRAPMVPPRRQHPDTFPAPTRRPHASHLERISRAALDMMRAASGTLLRVLGVLGGTLTGYAISGSSGAPAGAVAGWIAGACWAAVRDQPRALSRLAAVIRPAIPGVAIGAAGGLAELSRGSGEVVQFVLPTALIGFIFGGLVFDFLALILRTTGFGRIGVPRSLTPRWPRPVWLLPIWLVLSPLLLPRWLGTWAVPAADASSATAANTYRTDRRTSAIYASVYAVLLTMPFAAIAFLQASASFPASPGTPHEIMSLQWSSVIALVTWFTAWLGAGQVPLIHLAQLVLVPGRGRVSFRRLLDEASDRQVLRQAGAVYQFRHAALQARLTDSVGNAAGRHSDGATRPCATSATSAIPCHPCAHCHKCPKCQQCTKDHTATAPCQHTA